MFGIVFPLPKRQTFLARLDPWFFICAYRIFLVRWKEGMKQRKIVCLVLLLNFLRIADFILLIQRMSCTRWITVLCWLFCYWCYWYLKMMGVNLQCLPYKLLSKIYYIAIAVHVAFQGAKGLNSSLAKSAALPYGSRGTYSIPITLWYFF